MWAALSHRAAEAKEVRTGGARMREREAAKEGTTRRWTRRAFDVTVRGKR